MPPPATIKPEHKKTERMIVLVSPELLKLLRARADQSFVSLAVVVRTALWRSLGRKGEA